MTLITLQHNELAKYNQSFIYCSPFRHSLTQSIACRRLQRNAESGLDNRIAGKPMRMQTESKQKRLKEAKEDSKPPFFGRYEQIIDIIS